MKVTVLGCGGSGGVPLIGNRWGVCDPANPRNRRRRVSVLVEGDPAQGQGTILIDTSPDLREQLLDAGVSHIDAILWTHAHADHMNGIDDVRAINRVMRQAIAGWGTADTMRQAQLRFDYVFAPLNSDFGFYKPCIVPHVFTGPFTTAGFTVIPFQQDHGYGESTGFRIGDFAYSTDVVRLSDEAFRCLEGVKLWVVDCLRDAPHSTHSHLAQTLDWIGRIKPDRAVLTHMNEEIDYEDVRRRLPAGVEPGYDGLTITL